MKINVLAGIMAIALLFALTSCKRNDNSPAAIINGKNDAAQAYTTNINTGNSTTDTTGDITASTKITPVNERIAGSAKNQQKNNTIISTIPEIVAYYNTAANKVKRDKPGYKLTTTNSVGIIDSNKAAIEILSKTVIKIADIGPATITVPKGSNGDFPVKGQNYGSRLELGALKSAVCIDKGSTYEITLNFKDEKLKSLPADPAQTNHGKAMNVMTAGEFSQQTNKFKEIVKVQEFAPTYSGSYIKCSIEKSTGNLKTATYYLNTIAVVKAKAVFSFSAKVPLAIKEDYTLSY